MFGLFDGELCDECEKAVKESIIEELENMPCITPEEMQKCKDIVKKYTPKQKPCEDAVSRQAVLEQINCWIGSGEYRYTNATDYLNKRIKALQAVNPQEKAGYWMPIEYPTGVEAFGVKEMSAQELQCSECGKTVDISDGDFKYCPYCKARMFEPQESEDKE